MVGSRRAATIATLWHAKDSYELVTLQTTTQKEDDEKVEEELKDEIEAAKVPVKDSMITIEQDSSDEENEAGAKEKPKEIGAIVQKRDKKGFFFYERKILGFQSQEVGWIVIGSISQFVFGAALPALLLCFSEIYTIFAITDELEQRNESYKYTGILFALSVISGFASFTFNYSFGLAGARIVARLRNRVFENLMRQEVTFHDNEKNRSSILNTQLSSSVPLCKVRLYCTIRKRK